MSENVNRLGVAIVSIACHRLEWFFREQATSDQGIDAHIEEAPAEVGTGRLLALQIKSGSSQFKEATENGWVFRFDAKKAALWLGHALPVLIVLVDVENEVAYWERISSRTVVSTGENFKVEVPRHQVLSAAQQEWHDLASGLESKALARFDLAVTQLPPAVRRVLESAPSAERTDAAILAFHLAEGRNNPRGTAQSLLAMSPGWIQRLGARGWHALACYTSAHDALDLSAEAFELAADQASEGAGGFLAAAAINVRNHDVDRARDLVQRAGVTGEVPVSVAVASVLIEYEVSRVIALPPILSADSPDVRRNQVAQSLLSDHASRAGDFDGACDHARLSLQAEPENTSCMAHLARALIRRSNSDRWRVGDLAEAIRLLEAALDQRRAWTGPTQDILASLVQAYAFTGEFDFMLERCLPSPEGTASLDEADDPFVRRNALIAAHFAGRLDLVPDLSGRLAGTAEDRIAQVRAGTLALTAEQLVELWCEELTRSLDDQDHAGAATATVVLASLGHDAGAQIAPLVQALIIPADYSHLASALIAAKGDLDLALPSLRSLARRDLIAAEYLIRLLMGAGREVEAAQMCHSLYTQSGNPFFLIERARCLIHGNDATAESAALEAVGSTSHFPMDRADLYTYLAKQAGNRDNWDAAEKFQTQAVALRLSPPAVAVWNLVLTQLSQGKAKRAAGTIAQHRPAVNTRDEAELWLRANSMVQWDQAMASQALTLASRFDDPQLSAALLGNIISLTHGVDDKATDADPDNEDLIEAGIDLEQRRRLAHRPVPADLHREAFAAMQQIATKFGDEAGFSFVQGEPEQLVEKIAAMARERAASTSKLGEIVVAAREATIPMGVASGILNKGLTSLLVDQTLGPLISGAADDAEHEIDMADALRAMDGEVAVDASALFVLSGMSNADWLEGQFMALQVPVQIMWDVHRASYDARSSASSPGTLGWDGRDESLTRWDLDDMEFIRRLRRAQRVEDFVQHLAGRPVRSLPLFEEVGWLTPRTSCFDSIQLAHDQGIALWSDDIALRRLARFKGVPSFGTPALVDVLRDQALLRSATSAAQDDALRQVTAANQELAHNMVVDVVLHLDDLLVVAERDGWRPLAGALAISRASWWAWQVTPIQDILNLLEAVAHNRPAALSDWQYAAMLGAARAYEPVEAKTRMLASLALLGHSGDAPSVDIIARGMLCARRAAKDLALLDPLEQVHASAASLHLAGRCADPQALATAVLARVEQLADEGTASP
ncbi:DUF4365 domain-containing protein [Catellatospora citrea]|uniref:DUF4365 domain-containing protein n=1 Tax=Catellatospora citrea TaxID=53366 RepID=A0A8J3P464_9ACTN|nr:DUF4365 domain-containing protein [Catellatospora citrea]RKE10523.1 uncharacterized protein DUF4365 [Catellatospora citrea]GIG03049.1 hypothetical protein Cci01nite_81420 [Catellatospora citrea]